MDKIWDRVRKGRPTAVLGMLPEAPAVLGLRLIRVRCDVPAEPLGPVLRAQRRVEQLLGAEVPLLGQAAERVFLGLRRRLLGELRDGGRDGAIVETWNRLGRVPGGPPVLVFDPVDAADEATLTFLRVVVSHPGWLRVPLLLAFRSSEPQGMAGALLAALLAAEGPEAAILVEPASGAEPEAAVPPPEQVLGLPADVLRVLRAGAMVGSGFEAELVAMLLGIEPVRVLELLQVAVDAGVPMDDHGEGRIHLREELVSFLRGSVLPSLAAAWNRNLAGLLSAGVPSIDAQRDALLHGRTQAAPAERAPAPERDPVPEQVTVPAAAPPTSAEPAPAGPPPDARAEGPTAAPQTQPVLVPPPLSWPYEELFPAPEQPLTKAAPADQAAGPASDPDPPAEAQVKDLSALLAMPPVSGQGAFAQPGRAARAARHHLAAGDVEEGAGRLLEASRQAAAVGAGAQAISYGQQALELMRDLPDTPRRRWLRARILLEMGRLKWHAGGAGVHFTLSGALDLLKGARSLLTEEDPIELRVGVATAMAGVYYDMGDVRSLEAALAELTYASRALQAAGDAHGAARLLNDQAAVYVRFGDPVQAAHLLGQSRKVFERRADTDPVAMAELAETDHLMARLPLHVGARPGREADAIEMGRDHARAADAAYRRLGDERELGRVWETMGRLELRAGRLERAMERLSSAARVQESTGDILGLARTTAALSEVLARGGQYEGALGLLADSVALNLEKGSPLGLAFNRRSLDTLAAALPPEGPVLAGYRATEERLLQAEVILGRINLPGEPDQPAPPQSQGRKEGQ